MTVQSPRFGLMSTVGPILESGSRNKVNERVAQLSTGQQDAKAVAVDGTYYVAAGTHAVFAAVAQQLEQLLSNTLPAYVQERVMTLNPDQPDSAPMLQELKMLGQQYAKVLTRYLVANEQTPMDQKPVTPRAARFELGLDFMS